MKRNKGFTLVELIVVLVILAILAAILTPALLGYIDKARDRKDVIAAKTLLDAAQAELVELYGKGYECKTAYINSVIPGVAPNVKDEDGNAISNNRDTDCRGTDFETNLYNLTGCEKPYLFMIATGSTIPETKKGNYDPDKHTKEKYTVYYAVYMKTEYSEPLYYYNGSWTKDNPKVLGVYKDANMTTINGKEMKIQYYMITNLGTKSLYTDYGNDKNLWYWLKGTVQDGKNRK
ncbi:prepilin-type N-terminal cleavage/methylation domain-containing protein [Lachnospiraceae bacterium NE2001]|nr:prepilin-type N-terminal cleavage/methylation domain-containing protein [Lachnospiraceae bacterium NE2001]